MTEQETYTYELIDICLEPGYSLPDEDGSWLVCEGEQEAPSTPESACDADGVPMGTTIEDIQKRQAIIVEFLSRWREVNTDGKVMNKALEDYIYFRNVSYTEAKEHSPKSYRSTRAVMMLDEVLENAQPVRRVAVKTGDKNQGSFAYMLIMVYRHNDLGTIKLTVGVRGSGQRIQYGITALRPGEPLIKDIPKPTKKKRRPH